MGLNSPIPVEVKEKLALAAAQAYVTNQMHFERLKENEYRDVDDYVEAVKKAYLQAKSKLKF